MCYAERLAARYGHDVWGRRGARRTFGASHWAKPLKWNRDAERQGRRLRVFCASMADVFEDHPALLDERQRLWTLIAQTPWLDWQLLTKRPENVASLVPWGRIWPFNVWIGVSVENQEWAERRAPLLAEIPAGVRFLSCEPLLEVVDLSRWLEPSPQIDWVIVGGESGPRARAMNLAWATSLVAQCRSAGVAVFVKQLGTAWARASGTDSKGGHWEQWPEDLRIREMPLLRRLDQEAVNPRSLSR